LPDVRTIDTGAPEGVLAAAVARLTADLADLRSTVLARTAGVDAAAFVGARAYRATAFNVPNAAFTAIPLNGETFDTGTLHDTSTNPSRITVPTDGHYIAAGVIRYQAGAGNFRLVGIYRNGSQIATNWTSGAGLGVPVADIVPCSAGDYLELYGYQDTGAALALEVGGAAAGNFLSVARLGD
jgi:hypothetical protein